MKKKNIEFTVSGIILRGTLFIPTGKEKYPSIISFHGGGGKGEKYYEWGEKFAQNGILFMAFNFTGCGKSDGKYFSQEYKDALRDAESAFKFLIKQQEVDVNRIGLIGGSFGGFVATMNLTAVKIKSLALLAPSAHADNLTSKINRGDLGEEVKYFLNKDNWFFAKSYENISKFTKPVLIIKSEYDENVPTDVVDRYFDQAYASEDRQLKVIKGADHRLSKQWMRDEAFDLMSDWFLKTL